MKRSVIGMILLTAGASVIADDDRKAYFTILGGVHDFHSSVELDEGDSHGAELGVMLTEHSALQISYSKINPDPYSNIDPDMTMSALDYVYYFKPDSRGGPYLRVGVGQYEFETEGTLWQESDIARFGMGFEQHLSDSISFRGEWGIIRDTTTNRYDNQLQFGFSFNFGKDSNSHYEPAVAVAPVQTRVVQTNRQRDLDGDGVYDANDQCPNTRPGITVDQQGCELDSDGDGVVNSADNCPATPAGARVDRKGCRLFLDETVRINLEVKFKTNSSDLQTNFASDIERVAKFMREYPDTNVVVEGHTDSMGKDSYNQWLSEKRAQTVASQLVEVYGIAANRVSHKGHGESKPIADNSTAEGRAKNRRVEAVIETTVAKPQ